LSASEKRQVRRQTFHTDKTSGSDIPAQARVDKVPMWVYRETASALSSKKISRRVSRYNSEIAGIQVFNKPAGRNLLLEETPPIKTLCECHPSTSLRMTAEFGVERNWTAFLLETPGIPQ
jgi:hypothetical protein